MTVTFQLHYPGNCYVSDEPGLNRFGSVYSCRTVDIDCAARAIAIRILTYAPQRQMLGSAAISDAAGLGFESSKAAMAMMNPGSQ